MHLKPTLLNSATVNMRLGKILINSLCYHKKRQSYQLSQRDVGQAEYSRKVHKVNFCDGGVTVLPFMKQSPKLIKLNLFTLPRGRNDLH